MDISRKKYDHRPWIVIFLLILSTALMVYAEEDKGKSTTPSIHLELTKEFYEALKNESSRNSKTYSNNPSVEYLKQISISTRFMVETNLKIIEQQERIIQLLHSLENGKKQE